MEDENANDLLFEKLKAEQAEYKAWLLKQTPEEILNHAVEYAVRENILVALDGYELDEDKAAAILRSDTPLADIYAAYGNMDHSDAEVFWDIVESYADTVEEKAKAIRDMPVYLHTGEYAREHGELEQYRESHKANLACKEAIEAAISAHYRDDYLDTAAVAEVKERFGFDRMFFVLANTVRQKDWDARFSRDNREWAQEYRISGAMAFPDTGREMDYIVNSHSLLTNAFISTARHEYLLAQPMTVQEIRAEAQRLLDRLQAEPEPNSPNGTHFMAEISPDFMRRAASRDTAALQKFLPFKALTLTNMKDRKGVFAVIAGGEGRDKKLREPRASVLAKLQEPAPASKAAPKHSAKLRGEEL